MNKIVNEYIVKAEALLLTRSNNIFIKAYLLSLKSLSNLPNIRLIGLCDSIPWVYEVLERDEDEAKIWEVFNAFSVMVKNAKKPSAVDKLFKDAT